MIALTYISMAQAFAGDNDAAMKTAAGMDNQALRNKAYGEAGVHRLLVNVQALRMGQPEEAVKRFADEALHHLPSADRER